MKNAALNKAILAPSGFFYKLVNSLLVPHLAEAEIVSTSKTVFSFQTEYIRRGQSIAYFPCDYSLDKHPPSILKTDLLNQFYKHGLLFTMEVDSLHEADCIFLQPTRAAVAAHFSLRITGEIHSSIIAAPEQSSLVVPPSVAIYL